MKKSLILGGVTLLLALALGYLFSGSDALHHIPVKLTDTNTHDDTNNDTIDRLKTYSGSDTKWGTSPFASGTPLTATGETASSGFVFKQPNTEWKTRTISGVTYVFGEGNPKNIQQNLDHAYNSQWTDGFTVRPETEKFLEKFLSNPTLAFVVNKCGKFIHPREGWNLGLEPHLPEVLFNTDFSTESMITIDPSTGEKLLDKDKFELFGLMFQQISFPENEKEASVSWKINLPCLSPGEMMKYQELVYQYMYAFQSWNNGSSSSMEEKGDLKGDDKH